MMRGARYVAVSIMCIYTIILYPREVNCESNREKLVSE